MNALIVATDFSAVSTNAARYAADVACMMGKRLTLFHAYSFPMPLGDVPYPTISIQQIKEEADIQMHKLKEELIDRTGGRIEISCEIREGAVLFALKQLCQELTPYAIFMGTESASAFERFLVGGKTVGAVRSIDCPLFIIPPVARFSNFRKVGLACDLRDVAHSVRIKEIKQFVADFNAEFHVLHVSEEEGNSFSYETVEESGLLQDLIGDLHPKYHFIHSTDIEKSVIAFAEDNKLDVLIVIPKEHNFFAKIFHHSHSQKLVMQAHLPVLSLHQ